MPVHIHEKEDEIVDQRSANLNRFSNNANVFNAQFDSHSLSEYHLPLSERSVGISKATETEEVKSVCTCRSSQNNITFLAEINTGNRFERNEAKGVRSKTQRVHKSTSVDFLKLDSPTTSENTSIPQISDLTPEQQCSNSNETEGAQYSNVSMFHNSGNKLIYLTEITSDDRIIQRPFQGSRELFDSIMRPGAVRSDTAIIYEPEHSRLSVEPYKREDDSNQEKATVSRNRMPDEMITNVPPDKNLKISYRGKQVYVTKPLEDGNNEIIIYPNRTNLSSYVDTQSRSSVIEITFRPGDKNYAPIETRNRKHASFPESSYSSAPRDSYYRTCHTDDWVPNARVVKEEARFNETPNANEDAEESTSPNRGCFARLFSCGNKKVTVSVQTSTDNFPESKRYTRTSTVGSERRSTCSSHPPVMHNVPQPNEEPEMESCICNPCDGACEGECEEEDPSYYEEARQSAQSRGHRCSSVSHPHHPTERIIYLQEVIVPGFSERLYRITDDSNGGNDFQLETGVEVRYLTSQPVFIERTR